MASIKENACLLFLYATLQSVLVRTSPLASTGLKIHIWEPLNQIVFKF